ncbi:hypothetical protein OA413_02855 [Pelagibacteraceae bacterium]|nr:hypothetical protein [Pelagibacteraceae bacterium]
MSNSQKSTDEILSAIKNLMEGDEASTKASNDVPLPEDIMELTKPISDDVLELKDPINVNKEPKKQSNEQNTLELNQIVDENLNVVDLSTKVQNNILDDVDESLIRDMVKNQLKISLETKIDIIIKEELNTLISDRISLSELSLKSKVLKN